MNVELLKEWRKIFEENSKIYIYGALLNAERLYRVAVKLGTVNQIIGFAVTSMSGNPASKFELPVKEVSKISEEDVFFLVPQNGTAKKEISHILEERGKKYCFAAKFLKILNEHVILKDEAWKATEDEMREIEPKCDEKKIQNEEMCKLILKILREEEPDFGGDEAYQSLELIGLKGMRPTLYRLNKYGLREFLTESDTVLDIGCNTGFIDMSIAYLVKEVIGIEYDGGLVKVANLVKDYLQIENVSFMCTDFAEWYRKNDDKKFNVIFSFAVHHWLDIDIEKYVDMLDNLLNINGILCFESQSYDPDEEFDQCMQHFKQRKYSIKKNGTIIDDGMTERKFYILQKTVNERKSINGIVNKEK